MTWLSQSSVSGGARACQSVRKRSCVSASPSTAQKRQIESQAAAAAKGGSATLFLRGGGGLIITKYNTPYMHAQAGHMPIIGILVNI